jgi:hypothetical protein
MSNRYRVWRGNFLAYRAKHPHMDAWLLAAFTVSVIAALLTVGLMDLSRGEGSSIGKQLRGKQLRESEKVVGALSQDRQAKESGDADSEESTSRPSKQHGDDTVLPKVPVGDGDQVGDDPDGDLDAPQGDDGSDGGDDASGDQTSTGDEGSAPHPVLVEYRWSNSISEYTAIIQAGSKSADVYGPKGLRTVKIPTWKPSAATDKYCAQAEETVGSLGSGPPPDGQLAVRLGCGLDSSDYTNTDASPSSSLASAWRDICDELGARACELSD